MACFKDRNFTRTLGTLHKAIAIPHEFFQKTEGREINSAGGWNTIEAFWVGQGSASIIT